MDKHTTVEYWMECIERAAAVSGDVPSTSQILANGLCNSVTCNDSPNGDCDECLGGGRNSAHLDSVKKQIFVMIHDKYGWDGKGGI